VDIEGEYDLMHTLQELSQMKREYVKVKNALESVRGCGYGVVIPEKDEITMDDPVLIKQGNKFGVKMKSTSPSIHMIKANIETEIAPIVGSEDQANDLIVYIKESAKEEDGIWNTNIFGKSVEQLVEDGIKTKVAQITEDSQVKLQESMQKIVNDSKGGMVCIII
jgi:stage IV sporulation protein A